MSLFFVVFRGLLPQWGPIWRKVLPVMYCRVKHRICHGFWLVWKCIKMMPKKTHFLAQFWRIFLYALLHSMSHASVFCQIEGHIKIHTRGKFHEYSMGGCQVINQFSIHEMTLIEGFWGLNSPKYCLIFTKFLPKVVFKKKKSVF